MKCVPDKKTSKLSTDASINVGEWVCTLIGIELVLGTRVKSADVRRKTLLTATGETISYKILIIATGARVLLLIS